MPIHQPFSRLPVWLRRVLTLLAVVVLAALLTHWRQNASTYATGFWDTGSQPLVFGRMLQIENHQSAPGGFMGVYTQEWSDGQNRTWFRENAPVRADDFQSYTHQSGLQGWAFGQLNRVFRLVQPSGEVRETWLYTTNCILFYTAELLLAVAVWQQAGPVAALVWVLAAVFAPWPQRGMKDLYWCLWTWLLPVLASLLLCRVTARKGRTPGWCFALVALAVYFGMRWLPAVPLLIAAAVALDALLALTAQRLYVQLVGQAICTEAAARQMREEKNEKARRRQAVDDLVAMQQDAQRQAEPASPALFADALGQTRRMPAVKSAPAPKEPQAGGHRRRRQAGFTVIMDDSTKQV